MVKGVIQTLEAAIAITIILSSIIYVQMNNVNNRDYSIQLNNCMEYLYKNGTFYLSESEISEQLANCLPPILDFTIKKCNDISCITTLPDDKSVFSSSYIISPNQIISVWVWEK